MTEKGPDDSWDRYWKHGFITSCSTSFSENYEGPLLTSWQEFFAGLPVGARILDIGTGNGAIAILANAVSRRNGKQFAIHGIDKADIDPNAHVKAEPALLDGIVFHGKTACEQTGFPNEYFDAVTGQYALEYTQMEKALPELRRVCRAGARTMFIVHHAQSIVMQITRQEIRDAALVFDDAALFTHADSLVRRVGQARTPEERRALTGDANAEALRRAFNTAAESVAAAIERSSQPDFLRTALSYVSRAYKSLDTGGLDRALAELQESEAELRAHVGRLNDLLRSAVSEQKLCWIVGRLQQLGFSVEPPREIYHDETSLMGWQIKGEL